MPGSNEMRTLMLVVFAIFFSFSVFGQETSQQSKPAPELKKLANYLGQWRYEGEYKASPFGPAMKMTGNATGEMILGGFFLEWRWKEQPGTQGVEIIAYDPINKNYSASYFSDDGSRAQGAYLLDPSKNSYSGKLNTGGKQIPMRVIEVFAPDQKSFTQKIELSIDGKSWTPLFEGRYTKLSVKTK
jgi:hypothetical protein